MKVTQAIKQTKERSYPCLLQASSNDVFYMYNSSIGTRLLGGKAQLPCGQRYSELEGDQMIQYEGRIVLEND